MDSTTDCDRTLLDRRDVGIPRVWEYNGGVGSLHDYLEVNISLAKHRGVMLGGYLHGHHDGHAASQARAQMIHEEQGGFFHPGTLPLTTLHYHGGGVEILLLLSATTTL